MIDMSSLVAQSAPLRFPTRRLRFRASSVLRSVLSAIIALWGVLTLVFFAILLTGNPATLLASPSPTKAQPTALTAQFGFDQSLGEQYVRFLGNIVTGNYPDSFRLSANPIDQLLAALPYTLALAAASLLIAVVLGLAVGYGAVFAGNRALRSTPITILAAFQATPVFVIGLLLILLFSVRLGWLPTGGARTPQSIILPAVALSLVMAPRIAQVFRASLLQLVDAEHVRAATAKQISLRTVRLRHVAANSLVPVVSVIGLELGGLLGGSVLTESLFNWPGIGAATIAAIDSKDYPVIIAAVVVIAAIFIIVNALVDLFTVRIDPRAELNL